MSMRNNNTTRRDRTNGYPSITEVPLFQDGGRTQRIPAARISDLAPGPVVAEPPATPRPQPTPRPAPMTGIDWGRVRELREEAATRLTARRGERSELTEEQDHELGRSIITQLVAETIRADVTTGAVPPTPAEQQALTTAVYDSLFRLGRLQPLVDDPEIENIDVYGSTVYVTYPDGRVEPRDPVFDDDEEHIDWLQFHAGHAVGGGRAFSESNPALRLNLPGDIRLSAMAWRTPHPSTAIRLHRLKDITLNQDPGHDLVSYGVMPNYVADMLSAATIAGTSMVISGPMGSGKTTLVRALSNSWDPMDKAGTAETERELFLHKMGERHLRVVPAEASPGGGERRPDGTMHGAYTLSDILYEFVRQQLDRVILGEVAGPEIVAMFEAMQMAKGTLSTTHAHTAQGAINRLVTLAGKAGMTSEFGTRNVAEYIDLIVQLNTTTTGTGTDRRQHRYVSEVLAIEQSAEGLPVLTTVYRGRADGTGGIEAIPGSLRDKLAEGGMTADKLAPWVR